MWLSCICSENIQKAKNDCESNPNRTDAHIERILFELNGLHIYFHVALNLHHNYTFTVHTLTYRRMLRLFPLTSPHFGAREKNGKISVNCNWRYTHPVACMLWLTNGNRKKTLRTKLTESFHVSIKVASLRATTRAILFRTVSILMRATTCFRCKQRS